MEGAEWKGNKYAPVPFNGPKSRAKARSDSPKLKGFSDDGRVDLCLTKGDQSDILCQGA
jgi:hypothetical protein